MTDENMKLWREVCITAPHAVKPITGKQYKGNSPKPYWLIQRATETFGPVGKGWGMTIVNERFERLTETDVLHVALIRFWYMLDGTKCEVEQMGQTKAAYKTAAGGMMVDEDAPKKSATDGMVKCMSMIGFAGDIFSGQWDDSKYVEWAAVETQKRESGITPERIAAIEKERKEWIDGWVATIMAAKSVGDLKQISIRAMTAAQEIRDDGAADAFARAVEDKKTQAKAKTA